MGAQQFEHVARQAEQLSHQAEQVNTYLRRIGEGAVNAIGGTATGTDQVMLGLTQQATTKARAAMSAFAEAARNAHNAAAAEKERERRTDKQSESH